jgi:hypothetical protein
MKGPSTIETDPTTSGASLPCPVTMSSVTIAATATATTSNPDPGCTIRILIPSLDRRCLPQISRQVACGRHFFDLMLQLHPGASGVFESLSRRPFHR